MEKVDSDISKQYITQPINIPLSNEIEYFEKKYLFKIGLFADAKLIIPEYKIELLNKSKKLLNTIENINKIEKIDYETNYKDRSKKEKSDKVVNLKKIKKTKTTKKKLKAPRTLWVRRKKRA